MPRRGRTPNFNAGTLSGGTQRQAILAQARANERARKSSAARSARDNASEAKRSSVRRGRSRPNQQATGQSVDRGGFRYTRFGD